MWHHIIMTLIACISLKVLVWFIKCKWSFLLFLSYIHANGFQTHKPYCPSFLTKGYGYNLTYDLLMPYFFQVQPYFRQLSTNKKETNPNAKKFIWFKLMQSTNSISTFPFSIDTVGFEPIASLPNNSFLSLSQNMYRQKSNPQLT